MNVGSICTRRVVSFDCGGTLAEAASLMSEHPVGAFVVTAQPPEGLQVRGIVAHRDRVIEVPARGVNRSVVRIGELVAAEAAAAARGVDTCEGHGRVRQGDRVRGETAVRTG